MKAILKFNLPEESHEYGICTKASELYSVVLHIHERFRSILKHEDLPEDSKDEIEFGYLNKYPLLLLQHGY